MKRDTLIDFFEDLAGARGGFLVYDDGFRSRTYTYQDVGRAARGFAARLAAQGIVRGDKIVFFSENRPEWVIAFWGCLLCGVIVVPIDYRASPDFLDRVARIVNAKLVLIGEDVPALNEPRPLNETAGDRLSGHLNGGTAGKAVPGRNPGVWRLHDLEWGDGAPPTVAIGRDDIAEI